MSAGLDRTSVAPRPEQGGAEAILPGERLSRLARAFDDWTAAARGAKTRVSRNRARLVFLLLRYTGAKLGEILALDDRADFALSYRRVRLAAGQEESVRARHVNLPPEVAQELAAVDADPAYATLRGNVLRLDQGYVRRILYERAAECGIPKHLANPNALRRSRAVELLRDNVPLTVVQRLLGHSSANSTAAFLNLSEDEQRALERRYLSERDARAARPYNTFTGRVTLVEKCDLQYRVAFETPGGNMMEAIISDRTLAELHLAQGSAVTARIKAPWLELDPGAAMPSPEGVNCFRAAVRDIIRGAGSAEVILTLEGGTRLCSIVPMENMTAMGLVPGQDVWACCSPHSLVLSVGPA